MEYPEELSLNQAINLYNSDIEGRKVVIDLFKRKKIYQTNLYVFGRNRYGQLGLGNERNRDSPILHEFFRSFGHQIKQISLGYRHSMILVKEFI